MDLIPIYTKNKKGRQQYTIFINKESNRSYKAFHREEDQWLYWASFFGVLALLRGLQGIQTPLSLIPNILLFTVLLGGSFCISRLIYTHRVYEKVREIYLTKQMIEDYIDEGKRIYKLEFWFAIIGFISFLILTIIYFLTLSMILLFFTLFLFFIFCIILQRLPITRANFYRSN